MHQLIEHLLLSKIMLFETKMKINLFLKEIKKIKAVLGIIFIIFISTVIKKMLLYLLMVMIN